MMQMYQKLSKMISYNSETGEMLWLPKANTSKDTYGWNAKFAGKKVGSINTKSGYVMVGLRDGGSRAKYVTAHRLAWYMHYGKLPEQVIDHIDGNKTNNKISNLRDVSRKENARNRWIDPRNKSGVNGVFWSDEHKKWRLQAHANGKKVHGGYFDTLDEAAVAAKDFFAKLGYSKRHGEHRNED